MTRRRRDAIGLALLLFVVACDTRPSDSPELAARFAGADIHLPPDPSVFRGRVPRNATLDALLRAHRVSEDLALAVVDVARVVFDPRRLRADRPYRLVVGLDGLLEYFEYEIDAHRFLRVERRPGPTPEVTAAVLPVEKERALISIRGEITRERPSLFEAMADAGEGVDLAMALAEIFSGEVDFNSELQPGDAFEIVFEKMLREDAFAGYGPIIAAELVNDGRRLRAVRFESEKGEPGYYDELGRSLKRFFLKSPLPFEPRVTSGFSRSRPHPVLHSARAHLGVDYGAPAGTPVLAVAHGVVAAAGPQSGAGRMVHVRHASGYETQYLHLSAIASGVGPGARIAQGQMIGRVGATGLATGPHLHYTVRQHGAPVNPALVHRSLPPGEPVPAHMLAAFEDARAAAIGRLFSAPIASAADAPER